MESKYEIKINIFQVFVKSFSSLWKNILFWIWILLSIGIYVGMNHIGIQKNFHVSVFLTPGITGLSFTLALIAATTRVFDYDDLAAIFLYEDRVNDVKLGQEYYDLIAPYLLSSLLWVITSIIALLDLAFNLDFYWVKFAELVFVVGGILSLWQLLYAHLQDVSEKAQTKINEFIEDEYKK